LHLQGNGLKKKAFTPVDPIGRYRSLLSDAEIARLEACLVKPPSTAVRFNPLKGNPQQFGQDFKSRIGWTLDPISFCPNGFKVNSSQIPPGRSLEARLGYFYIQDAASMLPVELFEPTNSPAPLILDLTAAPGGKSTHLASRFNDRGILVANDGTASRIPALTSTLKTWGATSSVVTNIPGEKFGIWFPETFDYVLLDAPCSMENMHFGDKNKREIHPAERGRLAQRQVQLLMSALKTCKVGGQIVYSTCTLAPEEDEGVLNAVMQITGKAIEITDSGSRLGLSAPGISEAFGASYSPETEKALRLWPQRLGTSGFFTAHFKKTGSIPDQFSEATPSPFIQNNLTPLNVKEIQFIADFLHSQYGITISDILEVSNLTLSAYKQSVYILPRLLDTILPGVLFRSTGLRLGDYTESGFEISLEWATRFGGAIANNRHALSPELLSHWARGEDVPLDAPINKGTILVITGPQDRVLGTGRVSTRGIKNLLPRHLALKS
jgi:16S rRNA (cytosine1407-C5)-methyltransferase